MFEVGRTPWEDSLCFIVVVAPYSDYHRKQNTLSALRKKALEKNPDEFYYKMISSQLQVKAASPSDQRYG